MKLSHLTLALLASVSSLAKADHTPEHKSTAKPHVHGAAQLGIALEKNNKVALDLDLPGDTAVGFEHEPKSAEEKAKVAKVEELFKKNFGTLVVLPADAKCVWGNPKIEVDYAHKGHSEWEVEIFAVCASAVDGKSVSLAFKPHFAGLKDLAVSVIGADFQTKHTVKEGVGSVTLSK
jgi:hypothetical protein